MRFRQAGRDKLDLPTGVNLDSEHGWLAIKPRKDWVVGGRTEGLMGKHADKALRDFASAAAFCAWATVLA